ncbi:hypothetical protein [Mycolicibacterium fortuitum]|uniref:hypothetical protein n=1 Tax=Mycolicibacterium fortuitum TaxID=1766 RepID=UPI001CE22364|nr:hypothetical protein [Mycolicibacterium fortuitum]MCA4726893.1 hypothetical protein [Mycolicibacterium fortuitum]
MTEGHHRGSGSLLARIMDRLGSREPIAETVDVPAVQPDPERTPDPVVPETPPSREHLYGSAYRVRVSADEVIRARGRGRGAYGYGRTLGASGSGDQRRTAAAAAVTGLGPDILWPE